MKGFILAIVLVIVFAMHTALASTSVLSVIPALNDEAVSVTTDLRITFSDEIDATTVSATSVKIVGAVKGYYSFTSSYSSGTKTLTITPSEQFRYGERIQVVLTSGLKDMASNAITPYISGFTTKNIGGLGTFSQSSLNPVGNTPEGIGTADLDGDGDSDFIVANHYSSSVSIFENNGSGVLTLRATISIGSLPQAVPMGIGDFDMDGDNDVIVPCRGSGYLAYLKNNLNWSFSLTTITTSGNPVGVIAGDLDSDGDLDLVAPNQADVKIFLNDANGSFGLTSVLNPGGNPHSPMLADIDNDGDLDLVVVRYFASSVIVYLNNGLAGFTPSGVYAVGTQPRTAEYADYDQDGDVDFVVSNSLNNTVTLFFNNGSGAFSTNTIYAGQIPHTATPIDIEGDDDPDLLISNGLILVNDGSGTFTPSGLSSAHEYPVVGDFDGDGDADIARVSNTQHVIRVLLNNDANRPPVADAGQASELECTAISGTSILLDGSGSFDPDGDPLEYIWRIGQSTVAGPSTSSTAIVSLPVGVYEITLTVRDPNGAEGIDDVSITVKDHTPPAIAQPSAVTFPADLGQCGRSAQNVTLLTPLVTDVCSGTTTITNDAPANYPVGETTVIWTAQDESGNISSVAQLVTIVDQQQPQISVSLSPSVLWPPNHQLATITANVTISDNCQVTYSLYSITSNEPDNGLGDGDMWNDIQDADYGTADNFFKVRKERSGMGTGRTYTATYKVMDASGNTAFATAVVTVPHSQAKSIAETEPTPASFNVLRNYPNPFRESTMLQVHVPEECLLDIVVTNALGQIVTRESGLLAPTGLWQKDLELSGHPDGAYFCVATARTARGQVVFSKSLTMLHFR